MNEIKEFFTKLDPLTYLLCHGDAADVLREFPGQSVNTCITSPPYWNQRAYSGKSTLGQEQSVEEYVQHLRVIFRELKRVLKEDGSF